MAKRALRPAPDPSLQDRKAPPGADRRPGARSETLERLLGHARSLVRADGAAFLEAGPNRWVESAAGWFASADLRERVEPGARGAESAALAGLAEIALERDRPLLLPRMDAWEAAPGVRATLRDAVGEPRAGRIWESLRDASLIACPVKTAIGETIGVLIVASLHPDRPLGADELRSVAVLADLSALALERADLLEDEARRGREELRLKRASEDVSASLEPEEVYSRIAVHAAAITGATKALLTRLDAGGTALAVAARVGFPRLARRALPVDRGMLGEVVRTRQAYLSRPQDAHRWDLSIVEGEPIGSFVHAPIELGPRLFGVLSVAHERPHRFGEAERDLLVKLARSSAAAIANATDFQRERRVARALTLGFVPEPLPEVPGFDVGLLFAPAGEEPAGGDLYGAWPLPGGEVALLVGDVAGKGVETAALGAMARFFVEARSWDSPSPSTVLAQANAMLRGRLPRDTFVTAFLGVLSPERLRYATAGHLPPLLVRAGRGEPLPGRGLPLGIDPAAEYRHGEVRLMPDDLLFAYTDGLVEARSPSGREAEQGPGGIYGLERLERLVEARGAGVPPGELVRVVHDEVRAWAGGLSDDAVALALRRRRP